MLRIFACAVTAALLLAAPQAQVATTIRIWRVGSPHTGDTPSSNVPPVLTHEASSRGWRLSIESISAQAFAGRFFAAARDGSAPDVLVFDNFGIMKGITTKLGLFVGINEDPVIRNQLIHVTGSFDELLAPQRGWAYLLSSSANHAAARELALRTPSCASAVPTADLPADLPVVEIATAYLAGDSARILSHADPEQLLRVTATVDPITVRGVAACGGWGNERLAFVTLNVSYQADVRIGHESLVLVFRKTSSLWQLLVVARDPVTNGPFAASLPVVSKMLLRNIAAGAVPTPAVLRSPQNGQFPIARNGARFGDFTWQSSSSEDVVAEIAEFSYRDDARLFLVHGRTPGLPRHVSAGQLWSTRGEWAWRVWSIAGSGEIAFSEVRTFVH